MNLKHWPHLQYKENRPHFRHWVHSLYSSTSYNPTHYSMDDTRTELNYTHTWECFTVHAVSHSEPIFIKDFSELPLVMQRKWKISQLYLPQHHFPQAHFTQLHTKYDFLGKGYPCPWPLLYFKHQVQQHLTLKASSQYDALWGGGGKHRKGPYCYISWVSAHPISYSEPVSTGLLSSRLEHPEHSPTITGIQEAVWRSPEGLSMVMKPSLPQNSPSFRGFHSKE